MSIARTASGRDLDLLRPDPAAICLRDIARHLSQINRYNGATAFPISVAQHAVLAARIAAEMLRQPPQQVLACLLHDAHEAYLGDITGPVRAAIGGSLVGRIEDRLDAAIGEAVGLGAAFMDLRRTAAVADRIALASEWMAAMEGPCPVSDHPAPWPVRFVHASRAEEDFLRAFDRLALLVPGARRPGGGPPGAMLG